MTAGRNSCEPCRFRNCCVCEVHATKVRDGSGRVVEVKDRFLCWEMRDDPQIGDSCPFFEEREELKKPLAAVELEVAQGKRSKIMRLLDWLRT
jgi:hypothetical protein